MDQDFFRSGCSAVQRSAGGIFVLFDQLDPLFRIRGIPAFFLQRCPKLADPVIYGMWINSISRLCRRPRPRLYLHAANAAWMAESDDSVKAIRRQRMRRRAAPQKNERNRIDIRSKKTANNASEDVLIAVFCMWERNRNLIWAVTIEAARWRPGWSFPELPVHSCPRRPCFFRRGSGCPRRRCSRSRRPYPR